MCHQQIESGMISQASLDSYVQERAVIEWRTWTKDPDIRGGRKSVKQQGVEREL